MIRRTFLFQIIHLLFGILCGSTRFSPTPAFAGLRTAVDPPVIALIIDDIGYSRSTVKRFIDIGIPLTFSILPALDKSNELARLIHTEKHESMLHQPMEPFNQNLDPGPGALYLNDSVSKIHRVIDENISSLPFITGINNHMGSKFTSQEKAMHTTIHSIKNRRLFFVDSLTANSSVAFQTACQLNVPTLRRNIFLDNIPDEKAVSVQLRKLKDIALKRGYAIGIGHPFRATIKAIDRFSGRPENTGIRFVHVSRILFPHPDNSFDSLPVPL